MTFEFGGKTMHFILLLTGMFFLSVLIAGLLTRVRTPRAAPLSEEARQSRREAALRSAERNRRIMQWVAVGALCVLAVVATFSWFSHDAASKEFGLYLAGGLALPFLGLWAKTRDDGFNPQLRKPRPKQSSERPKT